MSDMKMKQTIYGAPAKQVLATPDHYVALGFKHNRAVSGDVGNAVLVDGRYVVKAGTIYPANDSTAIGVVLNDYDVTDGAKMMAVVIHGFVKTAALPVVPVSAAIAAMKQISFVPLIAVVPTMSTTKADVAVGEAADVEHEIEVSVSGATFRPEASALNSWTITGESGTKVKVDSIRVKEDNLSVVFTTKNTAVTVAGSVTVKPKAVAMSTGTIPTDATTIVTVA